MSSRPKARFCYKTYHLKGEKVLKEGGAEMDLNTVVIEECKIMEDINHSLSLYVLAELVTEEEVKEAYGELLRLSHIMKLPMKTRLLIPRLCRTYRR